LSSCESEYIAAATGACQGVWLSRLLAELCSQEVKKFRLFIDNMSAEELSKNPVFHERSKHIDTRYHYIRECVGVVEVKHISTDDSRYSNKATCKNSVCRNEEAAGDRQSLTRLRG